MIDFDMMLVHVGEFGLYQKILFLFQAPFAMFVTFTLFGQLFIFLYPRVYWCREGPCINPMGLTPQQRRNLSVPYSFDSSDWDTCRKFDLTPSQIANIVDRAERACDAEVREEAEKIYKARGRRQSAIPCDYEVDDEEAKITRRARQFRDYYGRRAKGGPAAPTEYFPTTYRYPSYLSTTTTEKYGQSSWDHPDVTESYYDRTTTTNDEYPASGSSGRRTTLRPTKGKAGQTDFNVNNRRNNRTCTGTVISLRMNRNYSINAESIANITRNNRKSKNRQSTTIWRTSTCNEWVWEGWPTPNPYETIVSELNWWCNPETRITIANAVFYIGAIVGGIGIGFIADSRGRVPALVTANLMGCIGGALSGVFYQNFYVFCFFRFLTGMAFDNSFTMIYILVLEYVGPTYRTLVANLSIAVFYTMGTLILPWLALLIGNWRYYCLAISLPMSLALVAIFLVPESARWLLSKGRTKEATKILRSFAKVNGKKVDESIFVEFEEGARKLYEEFSQEEEASLWEAFKKPRIAKNFMFLTMIWALIALVYDGHSRNILNLGENVFVSFTIASSLEFPADMLLVFTLDRFGRRWLAFGSLVLSGVFSLGSAFIPSGMMTAALVTALISRFWVNVSFNIGLQYAAELLPTVIRAQGVNTIHICGYVASIISPFIASLGRTNPALSLTLLGIFACVGGVLCLFLPESLGEDLPNTLDEGQEFGKDQSFWNCPICRKMPSPDEMPLEPQEPTPIMLRNNLRASLRGETFRSSIISTSSSRRVTPTDHLLMNPAGSFGPSKLRRVYTQ